MKARLTTMVTATIALLGVAGLSLAEAGTITKREERQQKRIAEGVESGQLTTKETARLEREQAKIETDREKAWSDGSLTKKEKGKLTREQNRASRRIYRQKHDAQKRKTAE
jgi:polyhydroxyalkanoate synthesis regulator phasin